MTTFCFKQKAKYVQRNIRRVRRGKTISITHPECLFLALVIQHAKHILRIALSSVACLALPHFSMLPHKRQDFRKKKKILLNIKCVFCSSLQILSKIFLMLTRIQRDTMTNVHRSSCEVPVILVGF